VSDFGEAKWLPGLVDGNEYLKSMRGTSRYMAPEVVRRQYNAGADVYSIGCTVLEMLTGMCVSLCGCARALACMCVCMYVLCVLD
jgi:serine/threonine protein kinase